VDLHESPWSDFLIGDYRAKSDAIAEAMARAGPMLAFHVYDFGGENVFSAGSH
jgi:hypothetical protein